MAERVAEMLLHLIYFIVIGSCWAVPQTKHQFPSSTIARKEATQRSGKFFPVVKLVSFENTVCMTESNLMGTCFNEKECTKLKGESDGKCADNFGTCCIIRKTCGDEITTNNTYFQNPLTELSSDICQVELHPPKGTIQVKLDFILFNIMGPENGNCNNDTFVVSGLQDGNTFPILCGTFTGQSVFLDVPKKTDPLELAFFFSDIASNRNWNIKVSFLSAYDPCIAPPRCLQYITEQSGTISSFNYGTSAMLLNDQGYSICFATFPEFCDINFNFLGLDMGSDAENCDEDYVVVGGMRLCGTQQDLNVQATAIGPIILQVVSDGDNTLEQQGFTANYMYLPC